MFISNPKTSPQTATAASSTEPSAPLSTISSNSFSIASYSLSSSNSSSPTNSTGLVTSTALAQTSTSTSTATSSRCTDHFHLTRWSSGWPPLPTTFLTAPFPSNVTSWPPTNATATPSNPSSPTESGD